MDSCCRKKNLVSLVLGVVLSLFMAVFSVNADYVYDEVNIQKVDNKGDLTGDGVITLRDALVALKSVAGIADMEDSLKTKADVNDDSKITMDDVMYIFEAGLTRSEGINYLKPEGEGNYIIVDNKVPSCANYVFSSSREAVDYVNENPPASEEERITILFAPGVYREQLPLKAPYITFRPMYPDSEEGVTITSYYGNGGWYKSMAEEYPDEAAGAFMATLNVYSDADYFTAVDIKFENSYNLYITDEEKEDFIGYKLDEKTGKYEQSYEERMADPWSKKSPAQAVQCNGDKSSFYRCSFYGRQDTLYMYGKNRVYFEECFIEGTVDFIYGIATAVFNRCTINAAEGGGYLTAPGTDQNMQYGFLFYECNMTRSTETLGNAEAPKDGSYAIGRPWRAYGMLVLVNCKMDKHMATGEKRVGSMGSGSYYDTMRFMEYGTMDLEGNPLDLSSIVHEKETILEESEVSPRGEYGAWKWLFGSDLWNPGGFKKR